MARLLSRLGAMATRRRGRFLAAWLVILCASVGGFATVGSDFDSEATLPGTESQAGIDVLESALPTATGVQGQLVFTAPAGKTLDDKRSRAVIEHAIENATDAPQVATVTDPFTSGTVSSDRSTGVAQVLYPIKRHALGDASVEALEEIARTTSDDGIQTDVGGTIYSTGDVPITVTEVAGLGVAVIVLVMTFGSLLAAGATLATALLGLVIALVGLVLASNLATVSTTAPTLALMIGLAVGIDYALFVVSRHRSQLATGMSVPHSVARATATAGGAVIVAGLTVVIALAGLTVVGVPFLTGMGLAAAGAVALAVVVAVTLLPALLAFAGERLRPGPNSRLVRRELESATPTMGQRWTRLVTRHRVASCLMVVIGLATLALPATQLRLALPDNGTAPLDSTQRHAYDRIADAFGPGYNGRLLLLVQGDGPLASATQITEQLTTSGIATLSEPEPGDDGRTAVVTVVPDTGPRETETEDLVRDLRAELPELAADADTEVFVTGSTAAALDISEKLRSALLPYTVVVVGLSLLLLMIALRSILVPVKAAAGFLLSVGASLGAVVAAFQWGWLADVTGVDTAGPVFSFMPIIVIAVLFGLAMDYEVFLVSRIREEYVRTGDSRDAVIAGGRHSARVVTAAALIMLAVFIGFATTEDLSIKPIAFGLAIGIGIDAFLVRMALGPALLAVLADRAWWLPGWLDRTVPHLDLEGAGPDDPDASAGAPASQPTGAPR